jgi:hypothetical protein
MRRRNLDHVVGSTSDLGAGVLAVSCRHGHGPAQLCQSQGVPHRAQHVPPEAQACIECHRADQRRVCSPTGPRAATPMPTSPAWTATSPSRGIRMWPRATRNTMAATTCPSVRKSTRCPSPPWSRPRTAPAAIPTRPPSTAKQARQHHRDHVEAGPLAEQGHELGQRAQNGCYTCHGTVLAIEKDNGKLDPTTWPNVGVGRLNMDGSKGSCTSCHTRHALRGRSPAARDLRPVPPGAGPSPDRDLRGVQARHHLQRFRRRVQLRRRGRHLDAGHGLPRPHLRRLPHERFGQGDDHPRRHRAPFLGNPGPAHRASPGLQTLSRPETTGRWSGTR